MKSEEEAYDSKNSSTLSLPKISLLRNRRRSMVKDLSCWEEELQFIRSGAKKLVRAIAENGGRGMKSMTVDILLDINVLVYACDRAAEAKWEQAVEILDRAFTNGDFQLGFG